MRITEGQLRRIIREEARKIRTSRLTESMGARGWQLAMDERSDMMNMAMMDEDPNAVPNYKRELGKIARMLGTSPDALMVLPDDPGADAAFKPTRGARAQTLRSKNSYGDEWIKMATMGILDAEPVLQVHDTDSDMKTYYK